LPADLSPGGRRIIEMIERLIDSRPFKADSVAKITGVQLEQTTGTPYFDIARSASSTGSIRAIEVRTPKGAGDGLVIVDLADADCLRRDELSKVYGPKPALNVQPPEIGGTTLTYRFDWGELRVSYAATGDCASSVVLDATKR
jgi:hypothetical protein